MIVVCQVTESSRGFWGVKPEILIMLWSDFVIQAAPISAIVPKELTMFSLVTKIT